MNKTFKRYISLIVVSLLVLSTVTLPVVANTTSLFDFQMKDKTDSQVVGMFQEKSINSVVTTNDADGYINFIANSSAVNDSPRYLFHGYYGAEKAYTGKITLEGKFKLTGTSNATLIPFAVTGKSPANNGLRWFNSTSPTVYAKNGKWYAVNTTSGYSYTSGATAIADVKEDVFYTLKIHYNIDGDISTVDTYTYELIEEGGATYTADTARYFGGNIAESAGDGDRFKINYDIEKITCIAVSGLKVSTYDSTNPQGFVWDYAKGYMTPATAPVVTSSLEDGATGVEAGTVVTLTFTEEMDTTTFTNIKLYKGTTPVDFATVEIANNKTYNVTLPTMENAEYSIVVPNTVISLDEVAVAETVIPFVGKAPEVETVGLFDFQMKDKTDSQVIGMFESEAYSDLNTGNDVDGYFNFIAGGSAVNESQRYFLHGFYGAEKAYTGKITLEGRFKLTGTSNATLIPFAVTGKSPANNGLRWFNSTSPTVYAKNGKWYAVNTTSGYSFTSGATVIADVNEDVFYTLKIHYNIDGDTTTVDTYTYELIEEGGATYTADTARYFGGNIAEAAGDGDRFKINYDIEKITCIAVSGLKVSTYDSTNPQGLIWDYAKGYMTPETEDPGDSEEPGGSEEPDVDEPVEVVGLFDYNLKAKTEDDIWALFSSGTNEKNIGSMSYFKNDDGYYVFNGTASTVEQDRYYLHGKHGNPVNYTGKFTLEGRFMLNSVTSVKYFPFAVGGKNPANNVGRWYNSTSPALYVENGKWYAADVTSGYAHTDGADYIADAKEDVFYTLKINYNIDGDTSTVDTYTFELIEEDTSTNYGDGVSRHFGGNIIQGDGGDGRFLTNYDIEKITSVSMSGMFQSAHNADNPAGYTWDYMKGYMTPAKTPVVTSSLADGATNVTTGTVVTLTFTEEMDTATFANIKLMKGATPVAIIPVAVNKKTCTVTLPELEAASYQLIIPATVVSLDEMPVSETVIPFTGAVALSEITPSDVKVNGNSSLGALPTDVELVVTANFTNTGTVANQKALLVAAVYGSDNIMKKIAYMPETLAVGQTKPMQATFGNYRAASGDYIKVFVWDDFSTMVPMSNIVRFPAE